MVRVIRRLVGASPAVLCTAPLVSAQSLGSFTWQLQSYCNRVTVNVTQQGSVFTLDGFDDQCGVATRASVVGIAQINPDGSVGLGMTIVSTPGGAPVHVDATLNISTLGGTWRDSTGASGNFVFNGAGSGSPRPLSFVAPPPTEYSIGGATVLSAPGSANLHVGVNAGTTSTGVDNTFVGTDAGAGNTTGSSNTFLGSNARPGSGNLVNATAIGANAQVDDDHALVLGSVAGVNGASVSTRVGIGTTSPKAPLEVLQTVGGDSLLLTRFGGSPSATFQRAEGTPATPTAVSVNQRIAQIAGRGFDGALYATTAAITFDASEAYTSTNRGTRMQFFTTANGSLASAQRMMIDHNGRVGIGLVAGPSDPLDVAGDIRIGTGAVGCVKDRDGTVLIGGCSSDARFKRDISSFPESLETIARLRPVHFYWRADEFPAKAFGDRQSFGLIAQEVEQVLPELVTIDEDGYRTVNYSKLPLLAIQAIKELKAENDALRQQLETQHGDIQRRLAALETSAPILPR